jgi:hypothetical protein
MAPDYLPFFITGPDATDQMMVTVGVFLLGGILLFGVLYLVLHSLPERMAHSKQATQFQLISILVLLALFTHQNIFWLAALILVVLDFPDVMTPLNSIARSLEKATGRDAVAAIADPEAKMPGPDAPQSVAPPAAPPATRTETKSDV